MSSHPLRQPGQPSLWRNISFLLMWSSVAASGFGDRLIQLAAEPMLGVYEHDASAAQITAGIMFFFFLPYMGLTVFGGWLADRIPRKWIMLACDEARALILLAAFFMASALGTVQAIPESHYWQVYLIMAATGVFAAIFNPAKLSVLPEIVAPRHLQSANAVLAGIALIASLVGLQVGGPIVENVSVRLGIFLGVLSYGVSGFFFAFLKVTPRPAPMRDSSPSFLRQMLEAMAYMGRHRSVRGLVVLNILFWWAAWVVNAAIAALNKRFYDVENYLSAKATMLATLGVGLLCGSVVVMWIRTRRESALVALGGIVGCSFGMVLLALNRSYGFGLALCFVIGILGGIFLICVDTLTQSITPNHLRGRVFGVRSLLNTLSAVVVNFVIWQLPEADAAMIPALAATAALLFAVAGYGLLNLFDHGPAATFRLNVFWRLTRLYTLVVHRLHWVGRHHLPTRGSAILAANHTGSVDPLAIQSCTPRVIRWVMLKSYRFHQLDFLWDAIQPVGVSQAGDTAELRKMLRVLKQGELVGIFPEGGAQRSGRELKPFQPGIGLLARRSGALIVPVWITGTPRKHSLLAQLLTPSRTTVIIGEPYRVDRSMDHAAIVADLRRRMLELAAEHGDSVEEAEPFLLDPEARIPHPEG